MSRAERVRELRDRLELYHRKAAMAPDLATRQPYDQIANETAREIVLLITDARGRRIPLS